MLQPRIAGRYAKSILDISIENGELDTVYADMQWLSTTIGAHRDLANVLRSPIIKSAVKNKIMKAVTAGKISKITDTFIQLLIRKSRESVLPEITSAFIDQYKAHNQIRQVSITTAQPLTETLRASFLVQLKKEKGFEKIELKEIVDEKIVGGYILQVGDKLIDVSIAYDLRAITKQFNNNDFIYNIR